MCNDIDEMLDNGYYKLEVYSKKSFNKILRINASQVLSIYSHTLTIKEWQEYKGESFSDLHISDMWLEKDCITYHKIINVRDTYEFYSHTYNSVFFETLSQCLSHFAKVAVDNG